MGSYLRINGREYNSKFFASIMMDAIRGLDTAMQNDSRLTKKERKIFTPEYRNENGVGCGEWYIKRQGIALLLRRLRAYREDRSKIIDITINEWEYALSKASERSNEEYQELLYGYIPDTERMYDICIEFVDNILIDMVIYKQKKAHLDWV